MNRTTFGALMAAATFAATPALAATTTIDFTSYPQYTTVTSAANVAISLYGGPGTGAPSTGAFNTLYLGNSSTGDYPTANGVQFDFTKAVKNLSFTFNNFGDNSGSNVSFTKAFAGATQTDFQEISRPDCQNGLCTVAVAGTGITRLLVDNGQTNTSNWQFGIGSISFDAAGVPEAATWAMMIAGFGLVGGAMRRRAGKVTFA